jgi:hypothetical protein
MRSLYHFILALSALLLNQGIKAQENRPETDSSLILMESSFDFGKIPQGRPVTHYFEVKNNGKEAFKLDNVQASCGCTVPEWDHEQVIEPGKTAKIKVGYNAAAEGPFTKNITVTYKQDKYQQLTIKGEVWPTPASSAPANMALSDLTD